MHAMKITRPNTQPVQFVSILRLISLPYLELSATENFDSDWIFPPPLYSKAPIWLLAPTLQSLHITNWTYASNGVPPERRDRQLRAAIELIQNALRLEHLEYTGNLEMDQEPSSVDGSDRFLTQDQIFKALLPSMASIPSVEPIPYSVKGMLFVNELFPSLERIHSEKLLQPLQKQDVLDLGKEVRETTDHKLTLLGDYLLDDEVAEEMVRIWNERHTRLWEKVETIKCLNISTSRFGLWNSFCLL